MGKCKNDVRKEQTGKEDSFHKCMDGDVPEGKWGRSGGDVLSRPGFIAFVLLKFLVLLLF